MDIAFRKLLVNRESNFTLEFGDGGKGLHIPASGDVNERRGSEDSVGLVYSTQKLGLKGADKHQK